jgi:hypothetical protein
MPAKYTSASNAEALSAVNRADPIKDKNVSCVTPSQSDNNANLPQPSHQSNESAKTETVAVLYTGAGAITTSSARMPEGHPNLGRRDYFIRHDPQGRPTSVCWQYGNCNLVTIDIGRDQWIATSCAPFAGYVHLMARKTDIGYAYMDMREYMKEGTPPIVHDTSYDATVCSIVTRLVENRETHFLKCAWGEIQANAAQLGTVNNLWMLVSITPLAGAISCLARRHDDNKTWTVQSSNVVLVFLEWRKALAKIFPELNEWQSYPQ